MLPGRTPPKISCTPAPQPATSGTSTSWATGSTCKWFSPDPQPGFRTSTSRSSSTSLGGGRWLSGNVIYVSRFRAGIYFTLFLQREGDEALVRVWRNSSARDSVAETGRCSTLGQDHLRQLRQSPCHQARGLRGRWRLHLRGVQRCRPGQVVLHPSGGQS